MVCTDKKHPENSKNSLFITGHLTERELDILACLYSGKAAKKSALMLNLRLTTVKTHIYNVMQKLGKHSRASIIDLVEKEKYGDFLRTRYKRLLKRYEFTTLCHAVGQKMAAQKRVCQIVCPATVLFESLRQDLRCLGIRVVAKRQSNLSTVSTVTIVMGTQEGQNNRFSVFETGIIVYRGDYYHLFWDVAEVVIPHPAVQEARASFETLFPAPLSFEEQVDKRVFEQVRLFEKKVVALLMNPVQNPSRLIIWYAIKKLRYVFLGLFIMGCVVFPVLQETRLWTGSSVLVRSALPLPVDAYLLTRPELMTKITKAFQKKGSTTGIQTVVLVGMGGMGKTILARQYARQQNVPVVFEMSTQDPQTLLSSFSSLARALAKTPTERKEIDVWKTISDAKDYRNNVIPFVARKLNEKKAKIPWLLVFDNVNHFADLEPFFPHDSHLWGRGHVLMTTRNETITCRDHINPDQVVTMTPLTVDERLTLFQKVLQRSLTARQQKETWAFLSKLPPFPLDITIAAHSIRRTRMGYAAYLQYLNEMRSEFDVCQHTFLAAVTRYDQTRYGIISGAVKQIISEEPAFVPLLWMISHLGQRPIPKELLVRLADPLVVDRFIEALSRDSLLTGTVSANTESHGTTTAQIVVHPSVQHNMLICLHRITDDKQKQHYDDQLVHALEVYGQRVMLPPVSLDGLNEFMVHLHAVLQNKTQRGTSLTPFNRSCLQLLLGRVYCYQVDPIKATFWLEQSLAFLSHHYNNTSHPRLRYALLFTGIAARYNGDYARAKILLEQSVALSDNDTDSSDPFELAMALCFLSYVYKSTADYDKAKTAIERSIEIYEKNDPHHPDLALAFSDLATVYYGGPGDYEKAVFYRLKSLTLLHKIYGTDHLNTLSVQEKLGMDFRRLGRYQDALQAFKASYEGFKKHYPQNYEHLSAAATKLGELYRLLGDVRQAEFFLKEGVEIATKYFGPHHIHTDWGRIPLAQLYIDIEQYDKAKVLLEKSLKGHQKKFGDDHDKTASVYHPLGLCYMYLKKMDKASECFAKSQHSFTKHYGTTHVDYGIFLKDFGLFYLMVGDYEQAETLLNQAFSILNAVHHIERYRCLDYLGDLYKEKSRRIKGNNMNLYKVYHRKALDCFEKARLVIQDVFPQNSFHEERLRIKIKKLREKV